MHMPPYTADWTVLLRIVFYLSSYIISYSYVIFYLSYIISIGWIVIKLKRYKRPTKIMGSLDYGYFHEQTLHTRAAIAAAINTSFVALALNQNSPAIMILISAIMCIFVVWILVGRFK